MKTRNTAPFKTHAGLTMVVAGGDCDRFGEQYAEWLKRKYPSLTVEYIPNQSGGSGLYGPNGDEDQYSNWYWDKFCND